MTQKLRLFDAALSTYPERYAYEEPLFQCLLWCLVEASRKKEDPLFFCVPMNIGGTHS
jgi:hypothetical protein